MVDLWTLTIKTLKSILMSPIISLALRMSTRLSGSLILYPNALFQSLNTKLLSPLLNPNAKAKNRVRIRRASVSHTEMLTLSLIRNHAVIIDTLVIKMIELPASINTETRRTKAESTEDIAAIKTVWIKPMS